MEVWLVLLNMIVIQSIYYVLLIFFVNLFFKYVLLSASWHDNLSFCMLITLVVLLIELVKCDTLLIGVFLRLIDL